MSTELLKTIADSNQWWAIGPEMILACAALGLLVLEILTPKEHHGYIPHVAILSLLLLLSGAAFPSWAQPPAGLPGRIEGRVIDADGSGLIRIC